MQSKMCIIRNLSPEIYFNSLVPDGGSCRNLTHTMQFYSWLNIWFWCWKLLRWKLWWGGRGKFAGVGDDNDGEDVSRPQEFWMGERCHYSPQWTHSTLLMMLMLLLLQLVLMMLMLRWWCWCWRYDDANAAAGPSSWRSDDLVGLVCCNSLQEKLNPGQTCHHQWLSRKLENLEFHFFLPLTFFLLFAAFDHHQTIVCISQDCSSA